MNRKTRGLCGPAVLLASASLLTGCVREDVYTHIEPPSSNPPALHLETDEDGIHSVDNVTEFPGASTDPDHAIQTLEAITERCWEERHEIDEQYYGRYYRQLRAARDLALEEANDAAGTSSEASLRERYRRLAQALDRFPHPGGINCVDLMVQDLPTYRRLHGEGRAGVPEIEGRIHLGASDLPQTGIGFRRDGAPGTAPEEFAEITDETMDFIGFGGTFRTGDLTFRADYSEGDGQSAFTIPGDSGTDSGVVYGELSPGGSSGIATPFGLDGSIRQEFSRFRISASYELYDSAEEYFEHEVAQEDPGDLTRGPGIQYLGMWGGYEQIDRDIFGVANYSGSSGGFTFEFDQQRDQDLTDQLFHLGLEGEAIFNVGGRVVPSFWTRLSGYYFDSDLDSIERNTSNFGPLEDRDFAIRIDDSEEGVGFHGAAGAQLDFFLSDRFSIFLDGRFDYLSDIGAIFNPNSGDQVFFDGLTTELRTEDVWSWQVGAGLRLLLDRPTR